MVNDSLGINLDSDDQDPLSKTLAHYRIDTTSENDIYELVLRGYHKVPGTNNWKREDKNRYGMPDTAVLSIIDFRRSMVTKTIIQGNMSGTAKWKIYEDSVNFSMDDFDFMLEVNGEDWNLGIAECNILSREMEEFLRLAWSRTLDNKERERDQTNENFSFKGDLDDNEKQKKIWK